MQLTSAPMIVCMLSKRGHCRLKISCRKWIVALHYDYARQGIRAATKIFRSATGRFAAVVPQGIARTFQVDGPIITPSFWWAMGRLWWRGCCLYRNCFFGYMFCNVAYLFSSGLFVFIYFNIHVRRQLDRNLTYCIACWVLTSFWGGFPTHTKFAQV